MFRKAWLSGLLGMVLAAAVAAQAHGGRGGKCVLILYDAPPEGSTVSQFGRTMAQFLQNLVGHFPEIQQIVQPVDKYRSGQLERCAAAIYLGTYFDNTIPEAFLEDFTATDRRVAWMGYNVWQLGERRLAKTFGARYRDVAVPDWKKLDAKKRPAFFKYYDYLGETFVKYGELGESAGIFYAASDIVVMDLIGDAEDDVVSWARHSGSGEKAPYVIRKRDRWFVADVPFTYIHEEDRYLIAADLLFDILDEKPRFPGRKPALVRFEDVHSEIPQEQLDALLRAAERTNSRFAVSLIPHFKDPHDVLGGGAKPSVRITQRPAFVSWLKTAESKGGTVIMHGYTHQSDGYKNPQGVSGLDWEFWDYPRNRPMPGDSPELVVKRLEEGLRLLETVGIKPAAWLTPHYAASSLDNVVFGQLFLWNVGRVGYAPMKVTQGRKLPSMMTFDHSGAETNGRRLAFFKDLKVEVAQGSSPNGQFFPYEIHGDVHGIRLIPEGVGYIQPGDPDHGTAGYGVDDMIRVLKRNRNLRDVWGSLFVHPFLTNAKSEGGIGAFNGDTAAIERLFREVRMLGYDFIDVRAWTRANLKPLRPEPIER